MAGSRASRGHFSAGSHADHRASTAACAARTEASPCSDICAIRDLIRAEGRGAPRGSGRYEDCSTLRMLGRLAWVPCLAFLACSASGSDEGETFDELTEAESKGALIVANDVSSASLKNDVGLHTVIVASIVGFRSGADGDEGTRDDKKFRSMEELKAQPHVSPNAIAKMVAYWRDYLATSPAWRRGMPTGRVDRYALFEVLARDYSHASGMGARTTFKDVVEQVLCRLEGANPGPLTLSCGRGNEHSTKVAVGDDGSFSIPRATANPADVRTEFQGKISASLKVTLSEYRHVFIARCPQLVGRCIPKEHWRFERDIEGVDEATATFESEDLKGACGSPTGASALKVKDPHVGLSVGELDACPACYRPIAQCFRPLEADGRAFPMRACLHSSVSEFHTTIAPERCARGEPLASFVCTDESSPSNICAGSRQPVGSLPRDAVVDVTGPCPASYTRVAQCQVGMNPARAVCAKNGLVTQKVAYEQGCPAGFVTAYRQACDFSDVHVCARLPG